MHRLVEGVYQTRRWRCVNILGLNRMLIHCSEEDLWPTSHVYPDCHCPPIARLQHWATSTYIYVQVRPFYLFIMSLYLLLSWMSLSTFFEMSPFFQSSSNVSFSLSFECLSPFPWYISIPLFILWFSLCLSSSIWNDFQLISSERLSLFQGCPFPPLSLYKMSLLPSPQNVCLFHRNFPSLSLSISGMSLFILIRMSLFLSPHAECISLSHSLWNVFLLHIMSLLFRNAPPLSLSPCVCKRWCATVRVPAYLWGPKHALYAPDHQGDVGPHHAPPHYSRHLGEA